MTACAGGSSHLAGVQPTIVGWPPEGTGSQAGGMAEHAQELGPDTSHRPPAGAGDRGGVGRRRGVLWEFLGMALVASGLCLAVVNPDLPAVVVHTIAAAAVELAP